LLTEQLNASAVVFRRMMQYRQLGKTGLKVSVIGVGAEYLKKLSTEEVRQIFSFAMEKGINYFDLVWNFPSIIEGLKQALDGQHKKVNIAFHLGSCIKNGRYQRSRDPKECEMQLRDFLSQLDMDAASILNVHYVPNLKVWQEVNKKGILALATQLKDEGIAKFISVSIHDPEVVMLAASTGIIDSIMHQINLANHKRSARDEALRRCRELGVGVVAMKPFAGGTLLKTGREVKIPAYKSGWKSMTLKIPECSNPTRLLSYALSQPAVCVALTGVTSVNELAENIGYLDASPEEKDYKALLT
jgi:predicted aldo/keto reductase-like oxidoreductase